MHGADGFWCWSLAQYSSPWTRCLTPSLSQISLRLAQAEDVVAGGEPGIDEWTRREAEGNKHEYEGNERERFALGQRQSGVEKRIGAAAKQ